jgi:tetratricopeptide (TPR) repeat protein
MKTLFRFRWLRRSTLVMALCCALPLAERFTSAAESSGNYWRDPVFLKRFMGSYGVRSEIEPSISPDEKKVFESIASQVNANPEGAIQTLRAATTASSSAALDFTLGNLHFQQEAFDAAAPRYRAAIKKFPDFMRAHKNLGMAEFRNDQIDGAIRSLARALELGGEDGGVYGVLGHSYLKTERHASAESAYRKALLFDPDYLPWKEGLANALLAQRRYNSAAALFDELLRADNGKTLYWLGQADAYLGLDRHLDAAANYEMVRRMGEGSMNSLLNLGDIYLNDDLPGRAVTIYLEALNLGGEACVHSLFQRSDAVVALADAEDASRLFTAIRKSRPEGLKADHELKLLRLESRVMIASGDSVEAVKILQRILEKDPLDGESILLLGDYRADSGQHDEAALLFERVGRIDGFEPKALVRRAELLVKRNKFSAALPLLRNAQALDPQPNVADFIDRLERLAKAFPK